MVRYVDLDKIVAEIEKLKKNEGWCQVGKGTADVYYARGFRFACERTISFLGTLEVKEVDLEKEIQKHINDCLDIKFPTTDIKMIAKDVEYTARKFFELGLKARIDKELIEEVYAHIDSIKDTADRMTSGNFMHNRASIKFSANTIAKVLELMGLKAQKGEEI